MTIHETITELQNKLFAIITEAYQRHLTSAERLILEIEWTEFLSNMIALGNAHVLTSFSYGLIMGDREV
jgi:hypothetical protein